MSPTVAPRSASFPTPYLANAATMRRFGQHVSAIGGDCLTTRRGTNGMVEQREVQAPWTDQELKHKMGDAQEKVEAEGQTGIRLVAEWEKPGAHSARSPRFPISSCGRWGPSWVITLRL